jgi:hypothetical protein
MFQAMNKNTFLLTIAATALLGSIAMNGAQAHNYESASFMNIDSNTIHAGDVCKEDGNPKDDGTRCE